MADLKLGNFVILQHVLQLIRRQAPHSVCVLQAMLRDNFGVKFIKLYEVWIPQAEVLEQLQSLQWPILQ